MFDRYEAGERAVLVHINFTQEGEWEDLVEFEMLVSSSGVQSLQVITGSRQSPHPKYYVGEGKARKSLKQFSVKSGRGDL
ncbi:GTP-binding protein HflX [Vibrio astriarenae]|nr:GTP-binding protein HflX [Vibrio sp. C7]